MNFNIYYSPFDEEAIEFNVNIDLNDSEIQELRDLIDPVADLSQGLMPILMDKDMQLSEEGDVNGYYLFDKFDDVIYPRLYIEILINGLNNGTIQKEKDDHFDDYYSADPEDLYDLYGPSVFIDRDICICEIPQELIPKVTLTKDDKTEEIHRYLLREQNTLIWSLYNFFTKNDILYDDNEFDIHTWDWIEERLTKIVAERIKEATPEELLRKDYNPLSDITEDNLTKVYPDPIVEIEDISPECPTPLIDDRFEDAFKTPDCDEDGYSESIPSVWGDYRFAEDANGIKIISAAYSAMIESRLYSRYLDEEALLWDFGRNRLLLYEPDPEQPKLGFKGMCWVYAKKLKPEYSNHSLKDIYLEKVNKI